MKNTYKLRKNAVIFHPLFDTLNEYSTYVYDISSHSMLKIKKITYMILLFLKQKPNSTIEEVIHHIMNISGHNSVKTTDSEIKLIIEYFIKNNVIQSG